MKFKSLNHRTHLLNLEFESYLKTEEKYQKEVDLSLAYIDVCEDTYNVHLKRVDIFEKKLQDQLDAACKSFKLSTVEYLQMLEDFQNNKITLK